jgi:hypothetical protein
VVPVTGTKPSPTGTGVHRPIPPTTGDAASSIKECFVIEEERKEGEARPLKTVEQIKEAIADIEKVIAHLEELREVYIRHVFTSMPMGLAITHESVTEDMKNLNLMHFRQRYIRSSLIVMLYELEKQAKGTE